MHAARGRTDVAIAGGMGADKVAKEADTPRLVNRGKHVQPITKALGHLHGIVGEPIGDVAVHPAALVGQRAGQVPVIQRPVGLDPACQHGVDQAVVIVKTFGV